MMMMMSWAGHLSWLISAAKPPIPSGTFSHVYRSSPASFTHCGRRHGMQHGCHHTHNTTHCVFYPSAAAHPLGLPLSFCTLGASSSLSDNHPSACPPLFAPASIGGTGTCCFFWKQNSQSIAHSFIWAVQHIPPPRNFLRNLLGLDS
ncbi:uncharacterized protein K489DRAFT_234775 [Dissoconium aciculare CBS 342.82]|uniref:Secreted protein n=1 Tax=Dissoconium aciculare CBS 342.82 TaxID=1314786 RepID=A0A6J3M2C3_9PEZI|nr:uncharacterized protein K489DRAFT_234775 [Dissoconium aciculare CBS 342.82]KAF1822170.1 hypothetical protein K489DRAFT_234775 [Dissoconium aciculare CBS 342.82]